MAPSATATSMAKILFPPPSSSSHFPLLTTPPASLASTHRSSSSNKGLVASASASASASAAPAAQQSKLQRLCAWLLDKGLLSPSATVTPQACAEGLGLFAQRSIQQGEEIVSVPRDLWMSLASARDSPIEKACGGLRPWVALAVFLLYEKNNPDSKWRAYIDSLPECLDSPLFWSDSELAELQGTQLLGSISGYQQHVESEYENLLAEVLLPYSQLFDQSAYTAEAFLWAFGILRSRTFPPLTGDDLALVPLADLVNHGPIKSMEGPSWERKSLGFFSRQENLMVRAPMSFGAGMQVFMQYGKRKSNGQLALDYGFVESAENLSAIRDSFMLTLDIQETDRFFADKLDIVELNGLNATVYFDLVLGEDLPDNLLPFLRLVALSGPDAFLLEALFRNSVWDHLQLPISRENEEAVCTAVLEGCKSALAGFTTTVDEDLNILRMGQLSTRMEMAVIIRLGEKRVLEELQLWFETQRSKLDQLEYYPERRLRNLGLLDEKGASTPWVFES